MAVKNKIFIPTLISSVDYQPVRTLPHIYFYNGLKECEEYYIQHYPSGSTATVDSTVLSAFPYLDYYDGLVPTTGSNSLLFFNETPPYGETPTASLYTEYWDTYVSLLYNPKTRLINASAIIPLADYFEMELNDIVQWRGNYYHLRAINDYNLKDGTCKLQLLGPIIRDAVSVRPFDCNFNFSSSFVSQVSASGGDVVTFTSGGLQYRSHTYYYGDETQSFQVSGGTLTNVTIMVIAAGGTAGMIYDPDGSGPQFYYGGAGGAGQLIYSSSLSLASGSYQTFVGSVRDWPGVTSTLPAQAGNDGKNSGFIGGGYNITAYGGGGGGSYNVNGRNGGSGGGEGFGTSTRGFPIYGAYGGSGSTDAACGTQRTGGGGGGAGGNASGLTGGAGFFTSIRSGSLVGYAGGGYGVAPSCPATIASASFNYGAGGGNRAVGPYTAFTAQPGLVVITYKV